MMLMSTHYLGKKTCGCYVQMVKYKKIDPLNFLAGININDGYNFV